MEAAAAAKAREMDADYRLLLRMVLPLFKSRHDSVVVMASSVYQALAPPAECVVMAKALVHAARSAPNAQTQYVILSNINTLATQVSNLS